MSRLFRRLTRRPAIPASAAYLLLVVLLTWPLPLHLSTHFLGAPTSDLGVYVWNLWIFSHELVEHGRLPFSTDHLFAYTGGTDFAFHNYTPLVGLLGTPLLPWFGIVATFNLLLLIAIASAGLGVYVLGRRAGLSPVYSWIAGGLFMASPALTSRESVHLSLIAAAPLPLFAAVLLNTFDQPRRRQAFLLGGLVAAAMYSDAYYGIYCVLIGVFLLAWHFVRIDTVPGESSRRVMRTVDGGLAFIVALVIWRVSSGATAIVFGGVRIGIETLHNVMMAFVILAALRLWLTYRPRPALDDREGKLPRLLPVGALSVAVALVLLSPLLAGIFVRYSSGQVPETPIYWRSSPRGVDLLAYFVPNPAHPWIGRLTAYWMLPPGVQSYPEFVAAFPLIGWLAIVVAWVRGRLPGMWVAFSAWFVALSLGPFIHVGGVNTAIIGPWSLLRYLPAIGMARAPARFAVVAAIGLSILAAFAVRAALERPLRRRGVVIAAALFGIAELLSIPRPLHAAAVPRVYQMIAGAGDERGRVLDLPTGVRDGTSSVGDFNAASQFFQTLHRRPLIGGYLSRVSEGPKLEGRRAPILRALFQLSERGGAVDDAWREQARASRERFLARSCVRYVVVDRRRASAALRDFAVDVLKLVPVHRDANYELLMPEAAPPCDLRRPRQTHRIRDIVSRAMLTR